MEKEEFGGRKAKASIPIFVVDVHFEEEAMMYEQNMGLIPTVLSSGSKGTSTSQRIQRRQRLPPTERP